MYMCVCVCVCVRARARVKERKAEVPHHFLLTEFNGHEGKGTIGKLEEDRGDGNGLSVAD